MNTPSTAVLLVNLGTPDAPKAPEVAAYLKEFLFDKYVIDIPAFIRFPLVKWIARTRAPNSAEAYAKIWTDRGSPLLFHTADLTEKLRASRPSYAIAFAMRYGKPSIRETLKTLFDPAAANPTRKLLVVPLYPQYSLAATETAIQNVSQELRRFKFAGEVSFIRDFYDDADFISAFSNIAKRELDTFRADHVIFSFHGLPERQIRKLDASGSHCLNTSNCCDEITQNNRYCYRAQSFATARALARHLGLSPTQYTVSFQSRLGRTPWIKPYTDHVYPELARKGVRRVAVMSPSFVADCLETLEEIAMRGRDDFIRNGGEELLLIPSLNSEDVWVTALRKIIERELAR